MLRPPEPRASTAVGAMLLVALVLLVTLPPVPKSETLKLATTRGPLPIAFLSSKTPYSPPPNSVFHQTAPLADRCEVAHVQYLSRHGSRHSNKLTKEKAVLSVLRSAGVWVLLVVFK